MIIPPFQVRTSIQSRDRLPVPVRERLSACPADEYAQKQEDEEQDQDQKGTGRQKRTFDGGVNQFASPVDLFAKHIRHCGHLLLWKVSPPFYSKPKIR